jgi:amidase
MADAAMEQAGTAHTEIAAGRYRGPLHGVPIALKDLFWTKKIPTAAGTAVHSDFLPDEDASVVRRLNELARWCWASCSLRKAPIPITIHP